MGGHFIIFRKETGKKYTVIIFFRACFNNINIFHSRKQILDDGVLISNDNNIITFLPKKL